MGPEAFQIVWNVEKTLEEFVVDSLLQSVFKIALQVSVISDRGI
jgi:hypothetical protein